MQLAAGMKKTSNAKLRLDREKIRQLTPETLARAAGGNAGHSDNPPCITAYTCPTLISCGTCGLISIFRCTSDTLTTLTE